MDECSVVVNAGDAALAKAHEEYFEWLEETIGDATYRIGVGGRENRIP